MTEANWTDLFSTIRAIFVAIPVIVAAIGSVLGAWWAYKAKTLGAVNSEHLADQDKSIKSIDNKVAVIATKAVLPTDHLRAQVEGLKDAIAAIRRDPGPGG